MSCKRITQQQRAYIIAHVNDRPRTAVARAAGIGMGALYRIVRENGGELRHDLSTKREGIEETVRRHYPTMTAGEISARFGYSKTRVNTWAQRLGVRHSPETEARMKREQLVRLDECRKRIDRKAAHEKWRRRRRMDELRVLSGQPQRTRFRFKAMPIRIYKAKWYLCRNYDYRNDPANIHVLLYGTDTRRVREAHYEKKYGLTFKPEGTCPRLPPSTGSPTTCDSSTAYAGASTSPRE